MFLFKNLFYFLYGTVNLWMALRPLLSGYDGPSEEIHPGSAGVGSAERIHVFARSLQLQPPSSQHVYKLSLMHRIEQGLSGLDVLLEGIAHERFHQPLPNSPWSVHGHLAHLGRCHEIELDRMDRIVFDDTPPQFETPNMETDEGFVAWTQMPTGGILKELSALRQRLLERLARLQDDDLERLGFHGTFGPMPLKQWLELFLAHEGHVFYFIFCSLRGH